MKALTSVLLMVSLLLLVSVSSAASAAILYVGPGETYTEIQPAINAAVDGVDTVVVQDGTYTGANNKNLDFGGKAITVRSENGPDNCIIDCEYDGRGFTFHNGETSNSVLDGFTITNGSGVDRGGAIHCDNGSSPTVINCIIAGNTATAGDGGAFWLGHGSSPYVKNCLIINNSCVSAGGGAFLCYRNSNPVIENCTIVGNTAPYVHPLPIGNGIYGMIGGGIYVDGSHVTLINSILWNNSAGRSGDQIAVIDIQGPSSIDISYSDVEGGLSDIYNHGSTVNWGAGNIISDPLFVGGNDYHLKPCSPAIDAGDPVSDYFNEPEPNGGRLNLGAYGNTAQATSSFSVDTDGDGVFDECDNCPDDDNPDQTDSDSEIGAAGDYDIRLDTDVPGVKDSGQPKISSGPYGHVYVAWIDTRNGLSDIYFNYSSDYGATWQSTDLRLDRGGRSSSKPKISSDSIGHVYVTWYDTRNGLSDIYFNYSSDYGATWQSTDLLLDTGGALSYYPEISSDSSGHVYVTWYDHRNMNRDIYFNYSSDYGVTWQSTDLRLDTDGPGAAQSYHPQISRDSTGHVYVTWYDMRNGLSDIYFNYSSDYGATWQSTDFRLDTDTPGAATSAYPQLICDSNGRVYVTWLDGRNGASDIYFNYSSDYGATWQFTDLRLDTDTAGAAESGYPEVSSAPYGHVYVTWYDGRNGERDIYFNYSSDYGATWQPTDIRLDTDMPGAAQSYIPQISSNPNGLVYVTWQDNRNGLDDVYFNYSSDYGATWQPTDFRLDTDSSGAADSWWPQISSDSSGNAYIAWQDNRNGDFDIYFSLTESNRGCNYTNQVVSFKDFRFSQAINHQ